MENHKKTREEESHKNENAESRKRIDNSEAIKKSEEEERKNNPDESFSDKTNKRSETDPGRQPFGKNPTAEYIDEPFKDAALRKKSDEAALSK